MSFPLVFLQKLGGPYSSAVETGLRHVGFFDHVPGGGRVFLKPNLTYPTYRPGVMTSYECLSATTEVLIAHGYRVIIGEADSGGYNRFSMDEVFRRMGINALCEKMGAQLVNISFLEAKKVEIMAGGRRLSVPIPKLLCEEIDAFITLPVPKIHMNTLVSMSIKNQWGCIQEPGERLKLHPYFSAVMYELNRSLPRSYSIIDGRFGLNRSGPMRGDVVELGWVLISDDLVAADRVCCRLMQIKEERVTYLNYFKERGWWCPYEEIQINRDVAEFQTQQFYLQRKWTDLPGLACFNSRFLAWLGYRSFLAGFAHWLLYLFREPFYDHGKEKAKLRKTSKT